MGTSVTFRCWHCGKATNADDLHRLGDIVSLGGYPTGKLVHSDELHRICRTCAMLYAELRARREKEIFDLVSKLSG